MTLDRSARRTAVLGLLIGALAITAGLAGCASSSITQTGGLSSYQGMTDVKTTRTKARIFVGGLFGAPPEWSDAGASKRRP